MRVRPACLCWLAFMLCFGAHAACGQSLWGYYPIHENDFDDYSGNGHHGTPVDGPATVFDGERGWAVAFNDQPALPSRVNCGTDDPAAGGQLTVSTWACWQGINTFWQGIAGKSFSYEDRSWVMQLRDSDGYIQWGGSDRLSLHIFAEAAPAIDEWQHLVGTCDGTTSRIYINGEVVGEGPGGFAEGAAAANVTLGFAEDRDDYDESFNGLLDEIHIFTRGLTADHVQDLATGILPDFGKAQNPDPADGAPDVVLALMRWTPGDGAVFHNVYLGTDPNLGPEQLVSPQNPMLLYYHTPGLVPGTTYYWRIDEIHEDGVTVREGDVWSFVAQPVTAYLPEPADGSNAASTTPVLTWLAGQGAASHHLYFGADRQAVSEGTAETDKGILTDATFAPDDLEELGAYYWRVDEVGLGDAVQAGETWCFTTFLSVDDFESYTDAPGEEIFSTWIDGWTNGTNGSVVGYLESQNGTFGETTIVHGGGQSMPLDYNNVNSPYYSEAEREFAEPQDWTHNEADTLTLFVRGKRTNTPSPLYIVLRDAFSHTGTIVHADPNVVTRTTWAEWTIPIDEFAAEGVAISAVARMYIGTGDRSASGPGGAGTIYIDDIRITRPVPSDSVAISGP